MIAFWLIVVHFYVFIISLILFSFYLFTVVQTDELTDTRKSRRLFARERIEPLDQYVTAVHAIHRSVLRRGTPLTAADLDETREMYGVRRVDRRRLPTLGFRPRILPYERKSQIYVPEVSPDSRRCDLWNEKQDVRFLVKCRVREGETACFNCIESRRYNRYCVHFPRPIRVHLGYAFTGIPDENTYATTEFDDDVLDIPANDNPDEGYCLPGVFKNIAQSGDGGWKPADETRNCNPNTGDWLLARLSVAGDTSYNWVCRCRYPNLMTNISTLFSDCLRPVGCQPHGQLDEESRAGRRNPYTQGQCLCAAGWKPDRDPAVGPLCSPQTAVSEDNLPQDVYQRYGLNMEARLRWPDDERVLDSRVTTVGGNNPRGLALPNPCRYDVLTGRLLPEAKSCGLVSERIDGQWVAFCVIQNYYSVPVRSSRDYLRNNNGEYTNACLLIEPESSEGTNTRNSILSYQVSREVQEARPDFGLLYAKSSVLERIFESVQHDPRYREFMSHVKNPEPVSNRLPNADVTIAHGDMDKWMSVYEQVPLSSRENHGLKGILIAQYASRNVNGSVVYNLHDRNFFWYVVDNPLGSVHWNNGTRADFLKLVQSVPSWILGEDNLINDFVIRLSALVFEKLQDRPQGFMVSVSNYQRRTRHNSPTLYPYNRFFLPFASGADIDDALFSERYYPRLWPTYSPAPKRPEGTLVMPFVYNTEFDYADGTLTLHETGSQYGLVLMAEQLCGEYKGHRKTMRNRLQQQWV